MGSPLPLVFVLAAAALASAGEPVRHVQEDVLCAEACLAMGATSVGHALTPDDVFHASALDPTLGRGADAAELRRACAALGIQPGKELSGEPAYKALVADLEAGVPSVVRLAAAGRDAARWVLVAGESAGRLTLHDPVAERSVAMAEASFRKRWAAAKSVRVACRVKSAKAPPSVTLRPTPAAYARHIRGLRARHPHPRFTVVLARPFVVTGDEAPATVRRRAAGTVSWAVKRLKALYFSKDPHEIIDVWLFKDKASYDKHTKEVFDDDPGTPFGYYSPSHKALIMNIATGGGTLVHEIVHPYMHANFDECPSWLNEGLASLYEQCGDREGRITGFVNWRLKGLRASIKAKELRSFESLMKTTSGQFYGRGSGSHYAQARYLCYYLQEHELLQAFFRRFQATVDKDPSGVEALRHVLGTKDLVAFQQTWQEWVLKLKR